MGLENRLAAKVFASVLPWIDQDHPMLFMHDEGGQNANALPDLSFQFFGSRNGPIRIEFKVVKASHQSWSVKLTAKQVNDWCQTSTYRDKPHCWIGVDETESQYYFWEQPAIEPAIQLVHPANGYRTVPIPTSVLQYSRLLSVFRVLLEFAEHKELCP